jgi:hypothetical protein
MRTLMTAASALLVLGLAIGTAQTQEQTQEQRQPSDKKKTFGKKGPGGPGFPGFVRPQPGLILPPVLQQRLNLTDEQKKEVEDLQKDVDSRLAKILTEEQRSQLKALQAPGRGPGFGGPGGPGFQKKRPGDAPKKENPPPQ